MAVMSRTWAMPNRWTYSIKPIGELLQKYKVGQGWVDPFCGESQWAEYSTDLRLGIDAIEALRKHEYDSVEGVLFDPPYSPRQIKECYELVGRKVTQQDTQNQWTDEKNRAALIIKPNGLCISFGWNSMGLGKARGFEVIEVLLVSHGGAHNDTICTVEKRTNNHTAGG